MLAKKQRLTRAEFSNYFKAGKRLHSPVATLIVAKADDFHGAVVVSKKVSKKAVVRNKLRRRAYAQLYNACKDKKTGVFIIVLKPKISTLTKKQQHTELADLIAQAK